jgi:hypothetical protein
MPAANSKRKNQRPSASKVHRKIMRYIERLEREIEILKTNPETTVGQLIPQMREAVAQNKRLSVLNAALLEEQGGKVTLEKSKLDVFETKVLSIKWELPEGVEDPALAESFIFSYEAITPEEAAERRQEVTVTRVEDEPVSLEVASSEELADELDEADDNDNEPVVVGVDDIS